REAVWGQTHPARDRPRRRARRLPARHRPERLRQDDAAPSLCRARGADAWRLRARRQPRTHRVRRARAARLPRADGAREPRPLRPPLPHLRATGTHRHAPRALRPLGRAPRACGLLLPRDAAAARPLSRLPSRAGPAPARRALQRAGRRGRAGARPRIDGAGAAHGLRRCDPRTGTPAAPRDRPARARMNYLADVGALARKDLLLELRARDTLPAMLLFVVSALVVFHFVLP